MLCYIMKIKVLFQNVFKLSKKLSCTDVFQVKTIQGVSAKKDREEHTSANHRRHSSPSHE